MQPSTRAHLQLLLTAGSPTSRLMCTWILSRLRALADSINAHMAEYHFARCTATLVDFIWNDLCAVFLVCDG
jgi:valyl-tRNA synthetase